MGIPKMTLKDLKKKEKSEPLKRASHGQGSVPHHLRPTINSSNRQRVIPVSSASSPAASRSANSNTKESFLGDLHVSTDIEITPTDRADSIRINMPKSSEKRTTRDRNSQSDAASSGSSGLRMLSSESLQRPRSPMKFFSEPRRKKSSRSSSAAAPDVARATCSSASKQFSRSGERMACSTPRCRYAYCSLNHLEQNPLPSIKQFMAAQRRLRRQSSFKRVGRASLLKQKGRLDDKFASVDTGQEVDVDEDDSNLFFEFWDHSAAKEGNLGSGYDLDSQIPNNDDDGEGYTEIQIQVSSGASDFCEPDGNIQNGELVIASAAADDDEEEGAISPGGHLDDSPINEADPFKKLSGRSEYQGEEIWESGFHQVGDSDDIDDSDSEENRNDGFEEADSPPQEITVKDCEDSNPALVPRIDVQNINMGEAQSNACDGDLEVVDLQPFEGPDIQSPKSKGQDEIQENEALEEAASEDIKPDLPVANFVEDVHVLDESDIDRQLDSKPCNDCIVVQEISKDSINAGEGNHDKAQIPVEFESTQKTNDDNPSSDVQEGYDRGLEQGTAESVPLDTEGPDEVTAGVISDKVQNADTFDADGAAVLESGQDNKLRKIFQLLAEMQDIKDEHGSDAFAAAKKSIESLLESVTSSRFSDLQISKSGDSSRSGDADANMQGSVCESDNSGDCHSEASDDTLMGNARDDCINIFKSFLDKSPDCSYDVSGSVKKWERAAKSAADNKSPSGRNFWRRRRVHPFVEENSGPESVHLRHLDLSDRKPSSEWMIDYILREIIRTLAPFRKRKVHLLVQAFEAVAPMAANSEARTVPVKGRKSQEKNGKGKT